MDFNLTGKRAIVCGSTQGIGKAAAIELAQLGASVTLIARDQKKLEEVVKELPADKDQNHDYLAVNFNDSKTLENIITGYAGGNKIHILVNNTGGPPAGPITSAKQEEFIAAFQMHLLANHIIAQAVIPGMKKEGYGRIINVISTSVKIPLKGLGVSNTIRAAVANWSKTLSNEVAQFGITVNNVLPGATSTGRLQQIIHNKAQKTGEDVSSVEEEMISEIPMGRFGKPEEIAAAIAFLATPAASYITGINVPVDGGRTGSL